MVGTDAFGVRLYRSRCRQSLTTEEDQKLKALMQLGVVNGSGKLEDVCTGKDSVDRMNV